MCWAVEGEERSRKNPVNRAAKKQKFMSRRIAWFEG